MSITMSSVSRSTQERVLSAIDFSQSKATTAVEAMSGTLSKMVPKQLAVVGALPGKIGVPAPHETVELTWGFAQQLVNRQRSFADDLVSAVAPAPEAQD